jgi:hypothetical protein
MKSISRSKSFIHFGCWNNGYCDINETNDLSIVMKSLQNYVDENEINFITVAGDNYYPMKDKKEKSIDKTKDKTKGKKDTKKTINLKNLKSGFECLPHDIPIKMILGNHDLETNVDVNEIYFPDNTMEDIENCAILNEELNLSKKKKIDLLLQTTEKLSDNTLIIMIDTSMYEDDSHKYVSCYKKYFTKKMLYHKNIPVNEQEDRDYMNSLREWQKNEVLEQLKQTFYTNIIIIGHHPITGWKKKNNIDKMIEPTNGLIDIFRSMYNESQNSNYYYLCADLHLFQYGTIVIDDEIKIEQFIVGTGGAKLDDKIDENKLHITSKTYDDRVSYIMKENKQTNGFLHFIEKNKDIYIHFIDVNDNNENNPIYVKKYTTRSLNKQSMKYSKRRYSSSYTRKRKSRSKSKDKFKTVKTI